jgi:hypothetical protein
MIDPLPEELTYLHVCILLVSMLQTSFVLNGIDKKVELKALLLGPETHDDSGSSPRHQTLTGEKNLWFFIQVVYS